VNLSVKLSIWIVLVMPFLVVCGTSHNSSRLDIYGHVKLEDPHESSRSPKKSKCLQNKLFK
jgi:hypothetical protein